MKNMLDCLSWIEAVKEYRKAAPEGFYAASSDRVPTLREVDPFEMLKLYQHFMEQELPKGVKQTYKLEGGATEAYCSLTIERFGAMSYKLPGSTYRFFYRKTSAPEQ